MSHGNDQYTLFVLEPHDERFVRLEKALTTPKSSRKRPVFMKPTPCSKL